MQNSTRLAGTLAIEKLSRQAWSKLLYAKPTLPRKTGGKLLILAPADRLRATGQDLISHGRAPNPLLRHFLRLAFDPPGPPVQLVRSSLVERQAGCADADG